MLDYLTPEEEEKFIQEFSRKMLEQQQARKAFWDSGVCHQMAEDIINKDYSLTAERWAYFSDDIRKDLNWGKYTDEQVDLFFDCLTSDEFPIDKPKTIDEKCLFENETLYRLGLEISLMWGQGTAIAIRPDGWLERYKRGEV